MGILKWRILVVLVVGFGLSLCFGHEGLHSASCAPVVHDSHAHHRCDHGSHSHYHSRHHHHHPSEEKLTMSKLPEELAEEEDLLLYGFGSPHDHHHSHDHDHDAHDHGLSGVGNFFKLCWLIRFLHFFCIGISCYFLY